jgi:RNA polymerase sigma-70 factor (ECF subfamily)
MVEDLSAERALVSAMLAGEQRAFTAFFDSYFPRIYRFALPRLGHNEDACKEVAQATLIKAMRKLSTWRGEATLFTWICQICRHEISNHMRSIERGARLVPIGMGADTQQALESIAAPTGDEPMQAYTVRETRRLIQSVLDRLPPRYGDVLEWKYLDGESVVHIGERLGIGQAAAQSLLARARSAFREALESLAGVKVEEVLAGMRGSG